MARQRADAQGAGRRVDFVLRHRPAINFKNWKLISTMPIELEGSTFYTLNEVADMVGVSRQTIWRWRKSGKVPSGSRYRGKELLFTQDEVGEISNYAHRLEPASSLRDVENN